jgi:hypothetical protein
MLRAWRQFSSGTHGPCQTIHESQIAQYVLLVQYFLNILGNIVTFHGFSGEGSELQIAMDNGVSSKATSEPRDTQSATGVAQQSTDAVGIGNSI